LRAQHPALGAGQFIPLVTTTPGAVAYLRHSPDQTAMVIANLTAQALTNVAVSTIVTPMQAGRYQTRALLGNATPTTVRVSGSGVLSRWTPVATLAPLETQILLLTR
jgi:hypothetical protein